MIPQYQFNLNSPDPLLGFSQNNDFSKELDNRISEMQNMKRRIEELRQGNVPRPPQPNNNQFTLFDEINKEVSSMTNSQKEILFNNKEYAENEYKIQSIIQQELVNLVKSRIESIPQCKELLEKQLTLVKNKKAEILEQSNHQEELFKKFQIASQANPTLTYAEFIKSINQ